MRQIFIAGSGEVEVLEVPVPAPLPQSVLVRNAYSLISTGTESSSISRHGGWRGAVEKGLRSGDRVKQVWDLARAQGVPAAWDRVRQKLVELSPPGYSSAGQVLEVSGDAEGLRPGDW